MNLLLISDTHFTDKPRDEYRWGLFPWLKKQVLQHSVSTIIHCGDVSDAKNYHSANFANRLVENFVSLSENVDNIIILRGNHDYTEESVPFFKFLREINKISFILEPTKYYWDKIGALDKYCLGLYPNSNDFAKILDLKDLDVVICHQTFKGAQAENGSEMDGIGINLFEGWHGEVWSGDIHVPQRIGPHGLITYVGSPYHIRFSDTFEPRILLVEPLSHNVWKKSSLYYRTVQKHTIDIASVKELEEWHINSGDQLKIRVHLDDLTEWTETKEIIKKYCESNKLDLHQIELMRKSSQLQIKQQKLKSQISPQELFELYCKKAKVEPSVISYGKKILEIVSK